jgi:hypothetical protein
LFHSFLLFFQEKDGKEEKKEKKKDKMAGDFPQGRLVTVLFPAHQGCASLSLPGTTLAVMCD